MDDERHPVKAKILQLIAAKTNSCLVVCKTSRVPGGQRNLSTPLEQMDEQWMIIFWMFFPTKGLKRSHKLLEKGGINCSRKSTTARRAVANEKFYAFHFSNHNSTLPEQQLRNVEANARLKNSQARFANQLDTD